MAFKTKRLMVSKRLPSWSCDPGHVTRTIYPHFHFFFPRRLNMDFSLRNQTFLMSETMVTCIAHYENMPMQYTENF